MYHVRTELCDRVHVWKVNISSLEITSIESATYSVNFSQDTAITTDSALNTYCISSIKNISYPAPGWKSLQ